MRKILTAAAAALTLAGGMAATTVPAQAQTRGFHGGGFHGGGFRGGGWRGGGGHWRGGGGGWGWGVGAGLAGFALGSALASPYYYGPGYYGYDYGPGYYDGGCATRVWDPYWGRWTVRYVC
ncbi:MAG TPA: hypothetical protein VHS81_12910 [Caulobacteraceae bacterium]|jgi:hypothetical protein|nr:hypothetical protein [Caulobacteraceae bacterium]